MLIKNNRLLSSIAFIIILFSMNSFANTERTVTPNFSIVLPGNLKQTLYRNNGDIKLSQYVYSSAESDMAAQQIRISVIARAPENKKDDDAWSLQTLGAMMAMFAESYHLNLQDQSDVLDKKPDVITIGDHTFSAMTMTFNNNIQAKFLVTIANGCTYMLVLVSIDKNQQTRNTNMDKLMESLKTVKYLGTNAQ